MNKSNMSHARALLAFLLCLCATGVWAQPYPAKPVRVVVPWPPAGVTDVLTRALAQAMSESTGQQFVVENRPGAGGTLGLAPVAKSAPDGYTIVASDVPSHAISATLYAKLPYDVLNDFEPIAMIAGSPMVLTTHPSLGVRTLPEFIKLAKASPGKLSYGSSGNGSITHLAVERLKRETGIDLVHVPYKGTVPAIASVLAGDTALAFGTIPASCRTPRPASWCCSAPPSASASRRSPKCRRSPRRCRATTWGSTLRCSRRRKPRRRSWTDSTRKW
jgi:tripartite-type tricarboxylate transporter receptor subunit TctC